MNNEDLNMVDLQAELEESPQVKKLLTDRVDDFLQSKCSAMELLEIVCQLVGRV